MSADEGEYRSNDNLPQVLRLRSQGTFLARSSDFTRDAAILHTTEIEVDIQGMHEGRTAGREGSAGVGFVSAKTRLDRIFQNDFVTRKSSSKPPPPPPPPPPQPVVQSKDKDSSASGSEPDQEKNNASSEADESSVSPKTNDNSSSDRLPSNVVAPPPIEGMYFRSPTRHIKLIKTRLSDLPAIVQNQEPQIRGGVAVYKVIDDVHRANYGSMVEINAIDYINRLKGTVRDLERQLSVVQGILEQERESSRHTNRNLRSSIRMGTFMGRRSKDPEHRSSEKFKRSQKGKNGSNASGTTSNASSAKVSPSSSQSEHKTPGVRARPPAPPVSFPRGFGFHQERLRDPRPRREEYLSSPTKPDEERLTRENSVESKGEMVSDLAKDDTKNPSSDLPEDASQSSISGDVVNQIQSQHPNTSTDYKRTYHPRKPIQLDRNAAPMPGVEVRRGRRGRAGRTKSFSGVPTDEVRKVSSYDYHQEKASRAMSMHRESNAEPPQPPPTTKKSRGVRKLFGLRS
ncbi:unnamed protein product [Agarophyton chilense]